MKKNQGYTLIELLVVMVIITILAGLAFRMMGVMNQREMVATTKVNLEKLANAIEEYRAECGHYPPVEVYVPTIYDLYNEQNNPWDKMDHLYPRQQIAYEFPLQGGAAHYNILNQIFNEACSGTDTSELGGRIFVFGLMSYLVPRYAFVRDMAESSVFTMDLPNMPEWTRSNASTNSPAQLRLARKIAPHLGLTIPPDGSMPNLEGTICLYPPGRRSAKQPRLYNPLGSGTSYEYTNGLVTAYDAWDMMLMYESKPPYTSYKLWSAGPNMKNNFGENDDIVVGTGY